MATDTVSKAYAVMMAAKAEEQAAAMAAKTTAMANDPVSKAYAGMMAAKAEEEQRLMQHQHVV